MDIPLSRQEVMRWAPSDVLEAGSQLARSGAVQGVQTQDNILGGLVKVASSQYMARLFMGSAGDKPKVICSCAESRGGKVCKHAIAVALRYIKENGGDIDGTSDVAFDAERAPTKKDILRWCGEQTFAKAEAFYQEGYVKNVKFKYPMGEGDVWVNNHFIHAGFKMVRNFVDGICNCYVARDKGMICEHAMAVAYAVMQQYASDEKLAQMAEARQHAARLANAKGTIQRSPTGEAALLRIFLPNRFAEQFDHGAVTIGIRVFIGKQALRPEDLANGRKIAVSEADEDLLCILEDIAGGAFPEKMRLSREDIIAVLRCAERSWVGDIVTRQRLVVSKQSLDTPLILRPDIEHDALLLKLKMPSQGHPYVHGRMGYWMEGLKLYPLAHILPEPFRMLYHEEVMIPRRRILSFFTTELPLLKAAMPFVEGDDITSDLFTTTPGTPKFRLHLTGTPASIAATLEAHYGAECVAVKEPKQISEPDPDDFYHCYVRNPEAEEEAMKRLHAMGFIGETGRSLLPVAGQAAVLNLLGRHVTAARRSGWRVELSDKLADFYDSMEMVVPVVEVKNGEQGAFELTTTYVSQKGAVDLEPGAIATAVRYDRAFIEHKGRTILIDVGALQTLQETCSACFSRPSETGGGQTIDNVHAPFVQAALEALEGIDFETSPDWRARASKQNRLQRPEAVPLGALEKTLRPYQKEGVYWLRFLEESGFCGILADEMGLGKTLQTITWLQLPRVREDAQKAPALVICPTSLVENWNREAEKFAPWLKRLVVSGPNRDVLLARVPTSDLVITSYALIRRDIEFYARCKFSVVVLDEAQAIKNQRTQNALAVKQLVADTRLVLSGTPIENGVSDLWSIMDFLMPRYLGPYEDFKLKYEDRIEWGGEQAALAQEQLRRKLHPFLLRRVKKDVAKDLPDKIRSVTYCKLTPEQRKIYDTYRQKMLEKMRGLVQEKGFDKSRMEVLALLMRLRQVCCDLRLLKEYKPKPDAAPSAKIEALMELLEEAKAGGHRVLIFSQFTSMLGLIAERLRQEEMTYCYLDGSTKNRLDECARFNQSAIPVFLISLKAGGTGLNLTGADTVVHFDPWWNPAAEDQATDRAHRIGQKKTVHAIKLIAEDTVEEKVLEMQRKKQALIEATVNASDASLVSSLTWNEIEALLC